MHHDSSESHIPDYIFPTLHAKDVSANNYAKCENCHGPFLKDSSGSNLCHRPKCVAERQRKQLAHEPEIECRITKREILRTPADRVAEFIEKKLRNAGVPIERGHVLNGTLTERAGEREWVYRWNPRSPKPQG